MTNHPLLQVFVPEVRRESNRLGLKTTVFAVRVIDGGVEHLVELEDLDFSYLHEQLCAKAHSVPDFPQFKFTVFDSDQSVEARREGYEKYLVNVLNSPSCVVNSILWVTLGVSAEGATVQRFIVRTDNLSQLEELSMRVDGCMRVASGPVLHSLLRLLGDHVDRPVVASSAVSVLGRVVDNSDYRLLLEVNCLPSLLRALVTCSSSTSAELLSDFISTLVEAYPHALFVYLQRDSGMTELIDAIENYKNMPPGALLGVANMIWFGVMSSRDIEIAITEKSNSVGMAILNKLLVRGQGTETELVAASILAVLYRKNLVVEYGSKIKKIIEAVISAEDSAILTLRFLSTGGSVFRSSISVLIGRGCDSEIDEACVRLGCFLLTSWSIRLAKVNDIGWYERHNLRTVFADKLVPIASSKSSSFSRISEATKQSCAEALVMMNAPLGESGIVSEKFLICISSKIQKINNFLISTNFDLSSRSFAPLLSGAATSRLDSIYIEACDSMDRVTRKQADLAIAHSQALNDVVSGMFQLKVWTKELQQLEEGITTCQHDDQVQHLRNEGCTADSKHDAKSCALASMRQLNLNVLEMNVSRIGSLVSSIERLNTESDGNAKNIFLLKTQLIKMKNAIDELLDEIDVETGSSPLTP